MSIQHAGTQSPVHSAGYQQSLQAARQTVDRCTALLCDLMPDRDLRDNDLLSPQRQSARVTIVPQSEHARSIIEQSYKDLQDQLTHAGAKLLRSKERERAARTCAE